MTYKGIVRGRVIELADEVVLPEGTEVEVMMPVHPGEELARSGHPRGSSQAIIAVWGKPSHCTPEDVDALLQAIDQGKRPVRYTGVFDQEENTPRPIS